MGSVFYGSTLLWLMARGMSLSSCKEYTRERIERVGAEEAAAMKAGRKVKQGYLDKKDEEIARLLVNACSQYTVAERVAKEWELFDSNIRRHFMELANTGWRSGNVTKGLSHANELTGGKILRRQVLTAEGAGRRDKQSGMYETSPIAWKFAALPQGYSNWPAARKKKYREQLARERRESRQ